MFILTSGAPEGGAADVNGDGQVDRADLRHFRALFARRQIAADLNGDGRVDVKDLALLRLQFGGKAR